MPIAHVDPAKIEELRDMYRRFPLASHSLYGAPFALRTGEAQLVAEMTPGIMRAIVQSPEHAAMIDSVGVGSVIVLPLVVQRNTFGVLTMAYGESGRKYDAADLALGGELARRASIAIDNARLYELSQDERSRVEAATRAKDEFVAMVSHELRTPLNAILGWLRILRSGSLPDSKRDHAFEVIERNARAQGHLVGDLLDISRIITGKLRITPSQVDLGNVIDMATEGVRPAADAKRIQIDVEIEPGGAIMRGDADRLQQVAWNLLANAVKFTPKNGVVRVGVRRVDSDFELTVEDNGSGIDPQFLPHVFESFRQADAGAARQHGGLGIGLSISKYIVEQHGGTIDAESRGVGHGAVFRVRLPISPLVSTTMGISRVPATKEQLDTTPPPAGLEGIRVLVVDDEIDARELLVYMFEASGMEVRTAGSAAEALASLDTFAPDVIVSDIGMPVDDGYSLIRTVRTALGRREEEDPRDRADGLCSKRRSHAGARRRVQSAHGQAGRAVGARARRRGSRGADVGRSVERVAIVRNEQAESAELSRRLRIALVTPIMLLVVMGAVLGFQVLRMSDDASWVDHTDEVIATATAAQKQIIDQETGLRGFLVTEDRTFLEPFEKANPLDRIERLRDLVSDNPAEVARVDELRRRYEFWLKQTASVVDGGSIAESRTPTAMRDGKREMDEIRAEILLVLDAEGTLRHARIEASRASTAFTKGAFIALFALAAVVLAFFSRRQLSAIAATFRKALLGEEATRRALEEQEWIRAGQMKVAESLLGDLSLEQMGERALKALASYVHADVGALFTNDPKGWRRRAGYALDTREAGAETFARGEGLVGAAAQSTKVVHVRDVPADFLKIRSGTGERAPVEVVLVPSHAEQIAQAVVELGFLKPVDARTLDLLGRIGESVAIAVRSTEYKARLRDLLEESQRLTEELQTQQEELRVSNEELEEQTNAVRAAQKETEARQGELEEANARLQRTQRDVIEKAAEAERASRYKSEFLANMSHELRTPLNSSLILAKLLSDNKGGNLTEEQVRFAQTISLAGNDLLVLINDVLDLSKIEAGKIDLNVTELSLRRLVDGLLRRFDPIARNKALTLTVALEGGVPETITSDGQRVDQILKNLLSNALKFTEKGEVSLTVSATAEHVRFVVRDTGIGIAKDQQRLIFDAFRQADGASNRKYGGTGLGLSISRDLAKLLGGAIDVESEVGRGSVFTLTLPVALDVVAAAPKSELASGEPDQAPERNRPRRTPTLRSLDAAPPVAHVPAFEDDRARLDRSRRLVLVIEDDVTFAKILFDLAHELAFQCIVAHEAEGGLALAKAHVPSAIVLDVNLPDHSGISVLDRLKHDAATRHVPVHVVSIGDYAKTVLGMGAVGYMLKPVKREELIAAFRRLEERLARPMRRLLIVEDDVVQRDGLSRLLEGPGVEIIAVGTVRDALEQLRTTSIDCVVTDLTLPDTSGFDLLEQMGADDAYSFPPVIVYTGRSLSSEEEQRLRRYSSSIIVKGARSPERLLDEVTLFLHQVESELPPDRQRMLRKARDREAVFDGRRVLIVEDDVRNIFALSSVLEPKGVKVSIARNGREALAMLESVADIDVVLMDIMMPEMDGIEAMQRIRQRPEWAKLPIIALTAKAMKDDQEKCLKAGANDYIAKPLDVEMLLSLLRVWMPK